MNASTIPCTPARFRTGGHPERVPGRFRPAIALCLLLGCIASGPAVEDDPTQPTPVLDKSGQPSAGYIDTHKKLVAEVAKKKPDILLIGDSITYNWRAHGKTARKEFLDVRNVVNLGIGGDRVENVLWRIRNGEVDDCTPKLAIILAGTNNIPRKVTIDQVAIGMKEILATLRQKQPQMKIVLTAVLPRGESPDDERRKKAAAISAAYAKLADGKDIIFLDIADRLLQPDGRFKPGMVAEDNLHLDKEGYYQWAEALEPTISGVLGDKPIRRQAADGQP